MSTTEPRAAVIAELKDAGWCREDRHHFPLLKHESGICWDVLTEAGGCALDLLDGSSTTFSRATPDQVVIAACLASTGQLDPTVDRAHLEERASWLGWLERAGLDNWPGVDEARRMRADAEADRNA
ncbi:MULTISPECIES: hypothetical protein [unclassified Streptomyces]|uniref:hypothetical protein n=1 Tax=unclassified Streptomyces TaxID=2593676 RepID=UPI00093EDF99|nr:hypothetical protein [Streptomyces sp. TSRI0281]OKI34973.1 hypothetical protein A6A29_16235 [Streptomyces sp. TSRI0281]